MNEIDSVFQAEKRIAAAVHDMPLPDALSALTMVIAAILHTAGVDDEVAINAFISALDIGVEFTTEH